MRRENRIVELAVWGFDESPDRDRCVASDDLACVWERAAKLVKSCPKWHSISPVLDDATEHLKDRLSTYATRSDVQMEFEGFEWRLAVVDRWRRPVRRKVIRISITEHFETLNSEDEKGAEHEHCNDAR